jgi:hypothetical protein
MRPSLLLLATPSSGAACMMPHRSALCAACTRRLMLGEHLSTITVLLVPSHVLQAVSVSNILRNWALMPGSERLLADAACVHELAHALEAASHDSGAAAAELAGNLLDVLQQVLVRT